MTSRERRVSLEQECCREVRSEGIVEKSSIATCFAHNFTMNFLNCFTRSVPRLTTLSQLERGTTLCEGKNRIRGLPGWTNGQLIAAHQLAEGIVVGLPTKS